MTIHLTPEQERRVQAVISRGAYESIEPVVDAGLAAVEQRTVPGFAGTHRKNSTPYLPKAWHRRKSRKTNFGVR
jgi:Arc/MetJ-type ribon-helix-helix transcriptional regulator